MPRQTTIKQVAEEAIRAGKTDQEALAIVRAAFPGREIAIDRMRWHRSWLRRHGENIMRNRDLRKMKDTAPVAEDDSEDYNRDMTTLAFDTYRFVKDLTAAGMRTEQAEVLASSYAGLVNGQLATKDDLKALEHRLTGEVSLLRKDTEALEQRLNARVAYAQVATVVVLTGVIGLFTFLAP